MECETKKKKMVATLQARKDALEAKLKEKTKELKKLCIQEAELTGILPPETPIEPGESPPTFRRRIGTAFTYPEALINKLKSKDEEVLAELEVQCRVQKSIAEAALALANDLSSSKSIRRKHRLQYHQSQRRISELETRLNVLKQSIRSGNQLKQRKKPRPPLTSQTDTVDGREPTPPSSNFNTSTLPSMNRDLLRYNQMYNSLAKSTSQIPQSQLSNRSSWNQRNHEKDRSNRISESYDDTRQWSESGMNDSNSFKTIGSLGYFSNQCYTTLPNDASRLLSKYGSLDRRHRKPVSIDSNPLPNVRLSPALLTLPFQVSPLQCGSLRKVSSSTSTRSINPPSDTSSVNSVVLLPNQTYPDNSLASLTRTQSLDNVERSKLSLDTYSLREKVDESSSYLSNTLGRKNKEKEWRETALDSNASGQGIETPPLHPRASKTDNVVPQRPISLRLTQNSPPPPLPPPPHSATASPPPPPLPVKSPELIKNVPYESPKNQTVVEVGKWQPYREVIKPFEMSDFYKYSTKFKKKLEKYDS